MISTDIRTSCVVGLCGSLAIIVAAKAHLAVHDGDSDPTQAAAARSADAAAVSDIEAGTVCRANQPSATDQKQTRRIVESAAGMRTDVVIGMYVAPHAKQDQVQGLVTLIGLHSGSCAVDQ